MGCEPRTYETRQCIHPGCDFEKAKESDNSADLRDLADFKATAGFKHRRAYLRNTGGGNLDESDGRDSSESNDDNAVSGESVWQQV